MKTRPELLDEFIGQKKIKEQIRMITQSAKIQKKSVGHILFCGPPGLGKTTLARMMAKIMKSGFISISAPSVEKNSDIITLLATIEENDIFFIDEIHRLKPHLEEILYTAMEDGFIEIVIPDKGSVKIELPSFTLIGATTKQGDLSKPLLDRFPSIITLEYYDEKDMNELVKSKLKKVNIQAEPNAIKLIAKASKGTPRIAERNIKYVHDYAVVNQKNTITSNDVKKIFSLMGIDERGLSLQDRKYLTILKEAQRPVGLVSLSKQLNEDTNTIERQIEPFLIREGYIQMTPQGRVLSNPFMDI